MSRIKKIVIVDDHRLFREGLKALIGAHKGFNIIAEAGTAAEGLRLAKKKRPDLMIIDINLPDKSGILLTREVQRVRPGIKVMIVSMHSKIDYIIEAYKAGAQGYVMKDSATENLVSGLEILLKGKYHMDSSIVPEVVAQLKATNVQDKNRPGSGYNRLTRREQQVFRFLVEGKKVKDISDNLFISAKTIENHRGNIYKKLELHSTVELMRYAVQIGLIEKEFAVN